MGYQSMWGLSQYKKSREAWSARNWIGNVIEKLNGSPNKPEEFSRKIPSIGFLTPIIYDGFIVCGSLCRISDIKRIRRGESDLFFMSSIVFSFTGAIISVNWSVFNNRLLKWMKIYYDKY